MKKIILLIIVLTNFLNISTGQEDWCQTAPGEVGAFAFLGANPPNTNDPYDIRVYLHIIRKSDGTMGVSVTDAMAAYNEMVSDFSPYNFCFTLANQDFIDNDDFVDSWGDKCRFGAKIDSSDDDDGEELLGTNAHSDGIDIYLLPDNGDLNAAFANGIPGTAFVVGGFNSVDQKLYRETKTFTHEMGHCLGLHHTFHGLTLGESISYVSCLGIQCNVCPELINGNPTNREECGDFIPDTPADPGWDPNSPPTGVSLSTSTCNWTNTTFTEPGTGNFYAPDATNHMAFTLNECRGSFTPDQVMRMKDLVDNLPLFQPMIVSRNGCNIAQRQSHKSVYKPLFNHSEWLVARIYNPEGDMGSEYLRVEGDTVINGKEYLVLNSEGVFVEGINQQLINPEIKIEFYREDTISQQIFTYIPNIGELLIFDFSLNVGDKHPVDTNLSLSTIETVEINGLDHRKFTWKNNLDIDRPNVVWLEGVGNIAAPFRTTANESFIGLLCMSQNGNLLFNEGAKRLNVPDPCGTYITVPTKNIPELDPALRLFPNPGNSFITISSEVLNGKTVNWTIRDVLGREIITQNNQLLSANHRLSIEQLEVGTYFITLFNEEGQQTIRFVKQ